MSALWVMLPNNRTRCFWESPLLPSPTPIMLQPLDPGGPGTVLWAFASLVGQELGSGLAGWLWLKVSPEVAFQVSAGLRSPEGLTGDRGLLPEGLAHTAAWRCSLSAGASDSLRFSLRGLVHRAVEHPHNMATGCHRRDLREPRGSWDAFYDLAVPVTSAFFGVPGLTPWSQETTLGCE